jgi:hypothetical protein
MKTPSFFIFKNGTRIRSGVSPVIATTIILAITIVLGLSLWSFANSGVSAATESYANVVKEYGKFTSDRFVVPTVAFDFPNPDDMVVWIYNSGKFDTQIQSVIVTCKGTCAVSFSPVQLTGNDLLPPQTTGDMTIASNTLKELHFDSSAKGAVFTPGDTYQVQVVSETGAFQTIYQKE